MLTRDQNVAWSPHAMYLPPVFPKMDLQKYYSGLGQKTLDIFTSCNYVEEFKGQKVEFRIFQA